MIKFLIILLIVIAVTGAGAWVFTQHAKFGPSAKKFQTAAVLASPNYVDGEFQNLIDTPMFTLDGGIPKMIWRRLKEKSPERLKPSGPLPSVKVDLNALDRNEDMIVWLGHSSFFVQLGGQRILIDPIFSSYASPLSFVNRAYDGTAPYSAEDMPEIDALLITHEHWDHLDYDTIIALAPKVRRVVAALGLSAYFEYWGYPADQITELDWNDSTQQGEIAIHALPARHYTRRLFASNQALWVSFALVSENKKLFFSGDSGYGPHFAAIGSEFGGFDFVALDSGQYSEAWKNIHMTPTEASQAAIDLNGKALMPIHVGRFTLSNHAWDAPFIESIEASRAKPYELWTPIIGDPVRLDDPQNVSTQWWEMVAQ